jgi:hypothetical protein
MSRKAKAPPSPANTHGSQGGDAENAAGQDGANPAAHGAAQAGHAAPAASGGLHTEHEDHPWTISIPDHPARADSPTYVASRALMNAIVKEVKDFYLGVPGPYQDHHGGGLWVKDNDGWFLIKNLAGMEWSQQFCADPRKVDQLRLMAQRIYRAFPQTIPAFRALLKGQYDPAEILETEIKTPADVARWCDSIFNASVAVAQQRHTGVLKPDGKTPGAPRLEGGVHHYPTPITDVQLFKRDDFQLWVADEEGQLAAVVPKHPRGSGKSDVTVAYATPGTKLHDSLMAAHRRGEQLELSGDHMLARQAFAAQQ